MSDHLCQLATDWRGSIPDAGWMAEPKVAGFRALWLPGLDGKARLWTRNGMPIEGVPHIAYRLLQMEEAAGRPIMFDGEFRVDGTLAATKRWCERGWKFGGEAGRLYLFDAMPVEQWRDGGCDVPAVMRKNWLQELWQVVENDPDLSWEWLPGSFGRDEELEGDWERISIAQMRGPTIEATARLLAYTGFTEKRNGLEILLEIYETKGGALLAISSSTLPGGAGREDARIAVVEPSDDVLAMRYAVMEHFNWENRARSMVRKLGWSLLREVE